MSAHVLMLLDAGCWISATPADSCHPGNLLQGLSQVRKGERVERVER